MNLYSDDLGRKLGTVGYGHLNLNSRLNRDGGDLPHNLSGRMQVNKALVDAHLKPVPGVGSLSTWGLTGGNPKVLGGHADRSAHTELLVNSRTLKVSTNLLKVLDITTGQGDPDPVDFLSRVSIDILSFVETRHLS